MDNLWNRLKPEYKIILQEHIDSGIYKHGPQTKELNYKIVYSGVN